MESGWNIWVLLVNVVSRRQVWLEYMGVASGCGCKEVYRFPIYISFCIFFCSSIPTFVHLKKCFLFFSNNKCTHLRAIIYVYKFWQI